MKNLALKASVIALMLGGCTTTGNVERNAGAGAAVGAIAGAVIGNNVGDGNAGQGAAIGAAAGGAAGAARGYSLDQRQTECNQVNPYQTYRDANGRMYYQVPGTTRTCWLNDRKPRGL